MVKCELEVLRGLQNSFLVCSIQIDEIDQHCWEESNSGNFYENLAKGCGICMQQVSVKKF